MNALVRTTCPYCGVGCGVSVQAQGAEFHITGDRDHPANFGRLCSKGSALGDTVSLQGRLLAPRVNGRDTDWSEALDHVAVNFRRIIDAHGPESVAFYVSGQLLTEDYYVANKLMKGYIGSANIDTNSRLCMSSAVVAHKRAFGADIVPVSYEDLTTADLIVLVGSNTAWCHPVLYQRIVAERERRPELKIVVIDPRRTATCEIADLHLPLRAGTDVWLFNGLLASLRRGGCVDAEFVAQHTAGVTQALDLAEQSAGDPLATAVRCGIEVNVLEQFYALFAAHDRVVTAFSQGVNQSSSGTDKANSIINCHLLTGRIGKPGSGPFSITGQPNAMGGREVGGMATMLAAHMELSSPDHRRIVQEFWNSPRIADRPGLTAVEMFDAIYERRVRAVWIVATNPVVSLPNADRAREALARCELVVVSDCIENTDTNALAQVLLPAAAWGEKDGTVTNSERRISRQRRFLPIPPAVRPDWWMFCEVAQRMGFQTGFNFKSAHEIFLEHAALSAHRNGGSRVFDLGGMQHLSDADYDTLEPVRWPVTAAQVANGANVFGDGRFAHTDGRARFIPTRPANPAHLPDVQFPFILNTGRLRDQWHTMTRTARAPRLNQHSPEVFVDMHMTDVTQIGAVPGQLVEASTRWGSMAARLRVSGEVMRGTIFVPIHWSDTFASNARVGALVNPVVDPLSGEPEFKHTPTRVVPLKMEWYGFILSREPIDLPRLSWWVQVPGEIVQRYEIAGNRPRDWAQWTKELLGQAATNADWLEYSDASAGIYRAACVRNDKIQACAFIAPSATLPGRGWLSSLFDKTELSVAERANLLNGEARDPVADDGPTVCACFGVGRNAINSAIKKHGLKSTQQIGQRLRAGSNCGSCIPELKSLLASFCAAPGL